MNLTLDSGQKESPRPQQLYPNQLPRQSQHQVITISGQVHPVHVQHGSVNSVIREQYCSCKPTTKMESVMLVIIIVMGFIIVGLVATISAVAKSGCDPKQQGFASIFQ